MRLVTLKRSHAHSSHERTKFGHQKSREFGHQKSRQMLLISMGQLCILSRQATSSNISIGLLCPISSCWWKMDNKVVPPIELVKLFLRWSESLRRTKFFSDYSSAFLLLPEKISPGNISKLKILFFPSRGQSSHRRPSTSMGRTFGHQTRKTRFAEDFRQALALPHMKFSSQYYFPHPTVIENFKISKSQLYV